MYQLTSWYIFLGHSQLAFDESESLSPCLQNHVFWLYLEPDECNRQFYTLFSKIHFNCILTHVFESGSLPFVVSKFYVWTSYSLMRSTWPSYLILLYLMSKYYTKKTKYFIMHFSLLLRLISSPTEFIYLEEIYEISINIAEYWAENMKLKAQLWLLSSLLFETSRCLHFGFFFRRKFRCSFLQYAYHPRVPFALVSRVHLASHPVLNSRPNLRPIVVNNPLHITWSRF
jgi:hypothetical protein